MKKLCWTISLVMLHFIVFAGNFTGTYSFNKGMNKASGSLIINQFSTDSAFFILQAVSGDPDFFTIELKGFIQIDSLKGFYQTKDSCSIQFNFSNTSCSLLFNPICKYDYKADGKYKRINSTVKKGSSLMPAFSDKFGTIKKDSVLCYSIPHISSPEKINLLKNDKVNITDDCNGFYLIEVKNKKNEFLWVSKKDIQLLKK